MFSSFEGNERSKKDRNRGTSIRRRTTAGRSRRSVFELLEMRALLTGNTYTPSPSVADSNNTADNNLRSAITAADADTGTQPDVIQLSSGTYTLTLGELDITNTDHTLIIEGEGSSGPDASIITQDAVDRVFQVASGVTVIFQNLEIEGGTAETDASGGTTEADGGGILSSGNVTLSGVELFNNLALATVEGEAAYGGGIYSNGGSLTIQSGSLISNNNAEGDIGPTSGTGGYAYGGGVYATSITGGPISITGSTITGNTALAGAGANGSSGDGGVGGTGYGGGVLITNLGMSTALMYQDTVSDNNADGGDGGTGSSGFNGGAAGYAQGGGLYGAYGAITISACTFNANTVTGGNGLSGTTYGVGGSAFGGGMEINGTGTQLLNDTIYGNMLTGGTGSTSGSSYGGGINDDSGGLTLVNDTITANTCTTDAPVSGGTTGTLNGGGINNYLNNDPSLALYNTIVAGNTATVGTDFNGAAATANANFIGDGTDATGFGTAGDNNQVGTSGSPLDPDFNGGLAPNGGPTDTVLLGSASTALGAGNVSAATAFGLSTDQRGLARVVGGKIDIGSVENQLSAATVTNASTTENTQTTAGLVITPAAADASSVNYFQITGITGGTLYLNDGTTPVTNGEFITVAQGAAGLKFTPTSGSLASGNFTVQESSTNSSGGLGGSTTTATISVSLAGATTTGSSTTENTQTTSGLVISPGTNDVSATYFYVTGISHGTLYLNDGVTQVTNGSFITLAQGEAGLKFTPTTGFVGTASFNVQESTTNATSGLSGPVTTTSITVAFAGPSVTNASTTENTQTTSGLVLTPGTNDSSAAYFYITGISGGTLYQNDGTTAIANGSYITLAQGEAGLKFTPTTGSLATGSFVAQESATNSAIGLSGPTATASINVALAGPSVTGTFTTENTQTTSGLVVTPGTNDTTAADFYITGITGGTLYENDGTTAIANNTFITVAQGEAGLKFTPTSGFLGTGSFKIQEATAATTGSLSGPTASASVVVVLAGPTVTNAATTENVQTTTGLVLTPGTNDTSAMYFQITGITGGTLYQNNGTTAIASGSYITVAQGEAGLKFTPTSGSLATGSFVVQESTTNASTGLSGATATASITVSLAGPTVTGATTTVDTQTTSGLVITPATNDTSAMYFQITGITGGTLYQNNGTTAIANGSFITVAQGEAGLKFTPTSGFVGAGAFTAQESTTNVATGLSGATATGTINVTLAGAAVTSATTTENKQTTSGLVITPGTNDSSATYFYITGITGGTLYQNNGTTPIANGSYITAAQGEAGLKFTPTSGLIGTGSFNVREATTNAATGLSGPTTTATIHVALAGPTVTNAITAEGTQTTGGLVVTPGASDTASYFFISGITGGTLYQHDGTTQITNNSFITVAQGEAGLKFTPNAGLTPGGFTVREATSNATGDISGPPARAAISVTLNGPTVTNAATTENVQTKTGLVLSRGVNDTSAAYFYITGITGGTLYQSNGTTPITSGTFITLAQGQAGLKFTPSSGSLATGSFAVQESTTNNASGLSGLTATATIAVSLAGPTVTNAFTIEDAQTTAGLVITPGAGDASATYFYITGITGGTLYQNNGTTAIANNTFITLAQGEAGLKFTPNTGSLTPGGFTVREATSNVAGDISGPPARAAITVTLAGPTVTSTSTTMNTQTKSGLVITPGAQNSLTTYFYITGITGGTLYQNNGTTAIANNTFITLAQGEAGLKFTPNSDSLVAGGFTVRGATGNTTSDISGAPARAVINVSLAGASVTNATTTMGTQTTSGLVITPGAGDSTIGYFFISGITGGTLYQNNGTTAIANNTFITVAQGEAGLKFTPNAGSLTPGGFTVREATTNVASGISNPPVRAAITVSLAGASVTNATTTMNTQTTSGLVVTRGTGDTAVTYFFITGITGGTLYQNNGTTAIANNTFITLAQGEAGLKFTPNSGSLVPGGFAVQEATTNMTGDISGPAVRAAITVSLAGATVTNATTTINTQTTSGLVITRGTGDTAVNYFFITGITGGTLYQNNGTTAIANNTFITLAQGEAGLKFTPNTGSTVPGGFAVQESTTNMTGDISGPAVRAAITVTLTGATVTNATTTLNTQTTSGLVITPGSGDTAATYFYITGITGGTLYQNNGTTAIANNTFITLAQGEAGLRFTPNSGSLAAGGFTVTEATGNTTSSISGPSSRASIAVTLTGPTVTGATTTANTQTTSGLVITPGAGDTAATYFYVTGISGGTLYQNNGTTQITSGSFITLAQGEAGLKFTPTSGSTANGSFVVQESTSNSTSGLSGPTATATITVGYAPTQAIDLSSDYNLYGITPNGAKFLGGLDGAGNAIPGSVVGTSQTWNNVPFTISSPKVDDVVQASGQTINLPNNVYQSIDLLGAAVNGNQPDVTFTVTYTDGTTQTYTQSISDWHTPQSYSGESVVVNSSYRNTQQGGTDTKAPFDVYGYSLPLNTSKAVESITLTSDSHVEILAMTVVGVSSSSSSG